MMRILQPAGWPRPRGYSNGVAARGEMVFVAGQIGWDTEGKFPSSTMAGQARLALENVVAVLREAGAKPEHIVRMTWYVTSRDAYMEAGAEIGKAFREIIGSYNAAMSAVQVCALMEAEALVEIEVTAVIPDAGGQHAGDAGGQVTDPHAGGQVTDPHAGGQVTDPHAGGQHAGGQITDPQSVRRMGDR